MTVADPATTVEIDAARTSRAEAMRASLDRARQRLRSIDPERALQILGGVLVPTGVIAIVLGWFGASRAAYDFEQIPYLISGGLLGVALAVVGGLAYFASWLTRLITHTAVQSQAAMEESGRQAAVIVEAIERLTATIQAGAGPGAAPLRATAPVVLVAAARGRVAHLDTCPAVAGRDDIAPVVDGQLPPCRLCRPDLAAEAVMSPT